MPGWILMRDKFGYAFQDTLVYANATVGFQWMVNNSMWSAQNPLVMLSGQDGFLWEKWTRTRHAD